MKRLVFSGRAAQMVLSAIRTPLGDKRGFSSKQNSQIIAIQKKIDVIGWGKDLDLIDDLNEDLDRKRNTAAEAAITHDPNLEDKQTALNEFVIKYNRQTREAIDRLTSKRAALVLDDGEFEFAQAQFNGATHFNSADRKIQAAVEEAKVAIENAESVVASEGGEVVSADSNQREKDRHNKQAAAKAAKANGAKTEAPPETVEATA